MEHIIFVLPGRDQEPVGGIKVVYEYANNLVKDYKVSILYPNFKFNILKTKKTCFYKLYHFFGFYIKKLLRIHKAGEWFSLNKNIEKIFCYKISKKIAKKYKNSVFIATAIETAYDLNNIGISKKNGFYLIQDFEAWRGVSDEQVLTSYRFPLNKIAIAPWLVEKVNSVGEFARLIPNGFDFDYFTLENPIENRNPYEIAMLYHLDDRKRCEDAFSALNIVKSKIPELHINIFGVPDKPKNLPNWYTYYQKPNKEIHNFIYNTAAVFIAASKAEGMALPPAEAMQCGAALCCTNIPGFALYAKQNETALLSEVYDVNKLAENILKLIKNNELRIKIAKAGNEFIQQFTWQKATECFKEYLRECNQDY